MSEPGETPALRIGTAERNAAMAALDAHLEAGRLDPTEYGERSARVVDARTAADLGPLFADLPAPHPPLVGGGSTDVVAGTPTSPAVPDDGGGTAIERWGPRVAGAMPLIAIALFFAVPFSQSWLFFLLIPLSALLVGPSQRRHGHPGHEGHDRRLGHGGPGHGDDDRRGD